MHQVAASDTLPMGWITLFPRLELRKAAAKCVDAPVAAFGRRSLTRTKQAASRLRIAPKIKDRPKKR